MSNADTGSARFHTTPSQPLDDDLTPPHGIVRPVLFGQAEPARRYPTTAELAGRVNRVRRVHGTYGTVSLDGRVFYTAADLWAALVEGVQP